MKIKDESLDLLSRAEIAGVNKYKKASAIKNETIKNFCKTKKGEEDLMDFIFGKTKVNPLENKKS